MPVCQSNHWNRLFSSILICWLFISLFFGYRGYIGFISKAKEAGQEQINVYFATEVVGNLRPSNEEPVLIVLPPGLTTDERWAYHFRIRYKLYPQKVDFAEPISDKGLMKVSYDYRQYKRALPVSIDPSNLLPLRLSSYRYIIAISGAQVDLPEFVVITDAEDVKGKIYERVY